MAADFQDKADNAASGDFLDDVGYVPTKLDGSAGTGTSWAAQGTASRVRVTPAKRIRGSTNLASYVKATGFTPSTGEYDIVGSWHATAFTSTAFGSTSIYLHAADVAYGSGLGAFELRFLNPNPGDGTCVLELKAYNAIATSLATTGNVDISGGSDGQFRIEVRIPTVVLNEDHYTIAVYFTRDADGFYLKPDGSWQVGQIACIDAAHDDAVWAGIGQGIPAVGGLILGWFDGVDDTNGVHLDNLKWSNPPAPGSVNVAPTSVVKLSDDNILIFTGSGTDWLTSTPTLTADATALGDGAVIVSQMIDSDTQITMHFDAPATASTVTFTDPSTANTCGLTVADPSAIIPGIATVEYGTPTYLRLKASSPSGGTAPFSGQWKRCDTATGSFAAVAGMTESTDNDDTLVNKDEHFYKYTYIDNVGETAETVDVISGRLWDDVPLGVMCVGDSWTGENAEDFSADLVRHLQNMRYLRHVFLIADGAQGHGGSGQVLWQKGNGSGYYADALAAAEAGLAAAKAIGGKLLITYLLGTNDMGDTAAATFIPGYINIAEDMRDDLDDTDVIQVMHSAAWRDPGGVPGVQQNALNYRNALADALPISAANGNILLGSLQLYDWASSKFQTQLLTGNLHPNGTGAIEVHYLIARAIEDLFYTEFVPTGGSVSGAGARMRRLLRP